MISVADIMAEGRMHARVQHNDVTIPNFNFYVSASSRLVMGVNLSDALGFTVFDSHNTHILVIDQSLSNVTSSQYPELTKEIGCIKG